jgi:MscS family membrane protein
MQVLVTVYDWLAQKHLAAPWPSWMPLGWPLHVVQAALALVGTLVTVWVARRYLYRLLQRLVGRTKTEIDDKLLEQARTPAGRALGLLGLYLTVGLLPLPEGAHNVVQGALYALGALVAVQLLLGALSIALAEYTERTRDRADARLARDFLPLLRKTATAVVVLAAVASVLKHFGQDPTALLGLLGVGSLAVGFAARAVLENTFAGFVILLDRPFRPGDRIRTANGQVGDVIDIGIRATQLKLADGNVLIVPNAEFVSSPVVNFAYPNRSARGAVEVGVAYGTDLEKAKALMVEAAQALPEVLREPGPAAVIVALADSAVTLKLGFLCADYSDVTGTEDELRQRILQTFAQVGIDIPFPQRVVHVVGTAGPR